MLTFIGSSLSGTNFIGTRVQAKGDALTPLQRNGAGSASGPSMSLASYGNEKQLLKYLKMTNPTYMQNFGFLVGDITYESMMSSIRSMSRKPFFVGGIPVVSAADEYMASCVSRQYKAMACPTGVYNVSCTEGTVKQMAEDARVTSLAQEFRQKQKPSAAAFGDMFDIRRRAMIQAHGCSYEETLHSKLPGSAAATVYGKAEATGTCGRLMNSTNAVEDYMMRSVEMQCKSRAVPMGVYGTACSDGSAKGLAEYRRVAGLAAKFRAGQWSPIGKEQRKFDSVKYARDYFAHGCNYEEDLFSKYPNMAGMMSAMGARY